MGTKNKLPFVEIEWDDAWKDAVGDTTLNNAHEDHNPIVCFSHGYVLMDDEEGIMLANEYSPNGTYRHRSFIPRKMIRDVKVWKWTKVKAQTPKPSEPETSQTPL